MTINGRLLLLVVATGLFVRVWSASDHTRSRPVIRTQSRAAVACPPNPAPATPAPAVMHQPVSATRSVSPAPEEIWTPADCPILVPAGMTAGSYRVVDDTGRVARLEIASAGGTASGTDVREVPADFHMTSAGARRWYFIRLQTPVAMDVGDRAINVDVIVDVHVDADVHVNIDVDAAAVPETETNPAPFVNPKFDFSGYVTSSPVDEVVEVETAISESVNEEIARPDSPDLPVPR